MVKFSHPGDREKVMSGGPWMIFDHYLAVTRWSPEFVSPEAKVNQAMVWIRFSGLNFLYYDESILLDLASAVGVPVKVDTNTLKVERGRFARVCVEVDLTKPVVERLILMVFGKRYNTRACILFVLHVVVMDIMQGSATFPGRHSRNPPPHQYSRRELGLLNQPSKWFLLRIFRAIR